VGVDDVSVLYPLPNETRLRTSLLGAEAKGTKGALLPVQLFRLLPALDTLSPNSETYSLLRVVAVRLDPCFPGLGDSACKNQVRMVMQPVILADKGPGLTTMDLAVHLFYELSRSELAVLLQSVVNLREASQVQHSDGPVGVHPALAREGMEGGFATGLRDLLLRYVGSDNLTRITFMGVEQLGQRWRFGGFDKLGGTFVPMKIPLVEVPEETFQNLDLDGVTFTAASSSPPSSALENLRLLMNPGALAAASDDLRRSAYGHALKVENPTLHSPDTIDCATCHVAMAARRFAERGHGLSASGSADAYAHPRGLPLPGATVERTNELRAFGYFNARPSVSQRTVNETAVVVERTNAEVRTP